MKTFPQYHIPVFRASTRAVSAKVLALCCSPVRTFQPSRRVRNRFRKKEDTHGETQYGLAVGRPPGAGHWLGNVGNSQQCLSTREWDPTWCSRTPECIGKAQSTASDSAQL